MDTEQAAQIKGMDDTINKIYHSKDGGRTAHELWQDAKEIEPLISLDWVKGWLRRNIERTKQIGGARSSYVAPHAYFEYQVDLCLSQSDSFQTKK